MRDERRVEEERVKRETEERLASFRQAQKASGTTDDAGETKDGDAVAWGAPGKKRKRSEKEAKAIVKGVRRRTSESEKAVDAASAVGELAAEAKSGKSETRATQAPDMVGDISKSSAPAVDAAQLPAAKLAREKPKLGLVDYGSDEDEDD